MISKKAKFMIKVLKKLDLKKRVNIISPKRSKYKSMPKYKIKSISHYIHGHLVMTMFPVTMTESTHIIYLHGGAYSLEANSRHFDLMKTYIDHTDYCVSYVDYPLAPEFTAKDTTMMVFETYKYLLQKFPDNNFILMGDSAGGGLALTLSMMIRDAFIKQPIKTLLFSPWLDVSMTNPEIQNLIDKDFILNQSDLKTIGKIYAGDYGVISKYVSPKYGDLNKLGDIGVFYGTQELFYPDCREFTLIDNLNGTKISQFEYDGMFHVWIIFSIPESNEAIEQSIKYIRER